MTETQQQTTNPSPETQQNNTSTEQKPRFFKIESGVARAPYSRRSKWAKFVMNMKPGDSMLVKTEGQARGLAQSIRGAGYRTRSENKNVGVRVWMLEALK